jgi:hypothetical protein
MGIEYTNPKQKYIDELREISDCPPDCSLREWLKILANFFDKYEGGQKIYLLEQELQNYKEYVGDSIYQSDYKSVDDMRKTIDVLQKEIDQLLKYINIIMKEKIYEIL